MEKILHYSRKGYGGKFNFKSACGKELKTHQDDYSYTIHPHKATCVECLGSNELKTDLKDYQTFSRLITRRIYIESDMLSSSEFGTAQRRVGLLLDNAEKPCVDRVFSDVLDYAWHDLETTWLAVKDADEIYATSSLLPLISQSYTGAPVIFNAMCERAIKENVTGKAVYILNTLSSIYWDMIDLKLMKKAFKKNHLYMYNDNHEFAKVDVTKIKK